MSVFTEAPEVEVRERRLKSIITYNGTAKDLNEKSRNFSVAFKDRSFSQCAACAEGCAGFMARTRDTVLIYHSPVGCGSTMINYSVGTEGAALARGEEPFEVHILSTNLLEKDTIFGAAGKLRAAIREAEQRFHPKSVYILTSCASGIIGEDIESVADEMEDELGFPVVPIYCEGFKSKIWSSGFDAGYHGILRKIVQPPGKTQDDLINIFDFIGTDAFSPLLSKIGLKVNYLAALSSHERLQTMSEAVCSTTVCETLSMYPTAALEEKYGVPEIRTVAPFGFDWTDEWLRAIGRATHREEAVEVLIAEERAKYNDELEDLKTKIAGKRLYITSGDSFAHNLASAARCLGLEVSGITTLHHDLVTHNPSSINTLGAMVEAGGDVKNFSVCNMQPYQVMKILRRLKPDVMICRHMGLTALGSKLGIPTLFEGDANHSVGYTGVIRMGRRIYEALETKKLVENIAVHVDLPYTDWWLDNEDPFYFEGGSAK